MRSPLVSFLTLLVLSLSARTAPIDPSSPPRSSFLPPHQRSTSLLKRTPTGPSPAIRAAETALAEGEKKDWKRPVVISISAIGVAMTVGWNYIAFKSFFANKEKYEREQRRLQAEKERPPPNVGDTICTVETYLTPEQVEGRKGSVLKSPCYRLGEGAASSQGVGSAGRMVGGGMGPGEMVSEAPAPTSSIAALQQRQGVQTATYPPLTGSLSKGVGPGGLVRRGMNGATDMVEEAAPKLRPSSLSFSASSSRRPLQEWIPLTQLDRARPQPEEERKLLSPLRHRPGGPLPGFPALQTHTSPPEQHLPLEVEEEIKEKSKAGWKLSKLRDGKKLKTEDITFGLTVLNTIGNIPSLILTTVNAYYYRGNPKVD